MTQIRGISNSASAAEVYINFNSIIGNTSTASTAIGGAFTAIEQTGAITNVIEINDNLIGESSTSTPAISYSATPHSSATLIGINNRPVSNPGTANISINNNNFYGFVTVNPSANKHIYIYCNHTATISSLINIDYNHFNSLVANTSGDVEFISTDGSMATSAGAQLSVSYNEISGTFVKSLSSGNVYLYKAYGNSSTGNTMTETGNNFSNISLTGTTLMHGWYNNEGLTVNGPVKYITDNVFDNWSCGTTITGSIVNAIYCDWASDNSEISRNTVSNITAYCALNGIFSASNTDLTLNGNQIFKLEAICSPIAGLTMGYNSSAGNGGIYLDPNFATEVIGINIITNGSTVGTNGIYYNTVFLNATAPISCGSALNFNTSCQVVKTNATPNVDRIILRNNIFINTSDYKNAGKAACIINKGSSHASTMPNYSSPTNISNNNVFWVGTRSTLAYPHTSTVLTDAHHVIYNDNNGTSLLYDKQDVPAFQAYVPIGSETLSKSFIPNFVSSIPTTALPTADLHIVYDTWNCPILDQGNSAGVPTVIATNDGPVYGYTKRLLACPNVTDIGCDQVIVTNTWKGTVSTAWNNNANWELIPYPNNDGMTAYIPIAASGNQPLNTGANQVNNLFLQCNTAIPLLTNTGKILVAKQISGPFGSVSNHNGCATVGSIEMNGSCGPQTISGKIFLPGIVDGDVKNFTASNTSYDPKVIVIPSSTSGELNVFGELGFGATGVTLSSSPMLSDRGITLKSGEFCPGISTTANVGYIDPLSNNTISGNVTVERYIHTGDPATGTPPHHARSWQLLSTPTSGQTVRESWMEKMATGNDNLSPGYGTNIPGQTGFTDGFDQVPVSGDGIKWWDHEGSPGPDYIFLANTSDQLNNPRGYFLFVRGDRSVTTYPGTPVPTTLRQKGSLFQPSNLPVQTTFPSGTSAFISVGNPYASAISLPAMVSTGGFNNIYQYVYVYDPSLGSLGGWQVLDRNNNAFVSVNATNTPYYIQNAQYPYIQSGNAFYVKAAATTAPGSIIFSEAVKSNTQQLVNRANSASDSIKMNATLYLPGNRVADGNVVFFGSNYSNLADSNDLIKLLNFGENFFIQQDTVTLMVSKRDLIGSSDSIFYSFSNLTPETYQLKFAPSYLAELGLTAILIDNYADTTFDISLDADTDISFVVDSNSTSVECRFTLVFSRSEISRMAIAPNESVLKVFPNPVTNRQFFVKLNEEFSGNCDVQVVNSTGQIMLRQTVFHAENKKTIRMNLGKEIPSGLYHVIVSDEKGKKALRHIIVR